MESTDGTAALKPGEKYTLDQWRTWPEGERWELIGGVAYNMSPAPRVSHQSVGVNLIYQLCLFLKDAVCVALNAPIDVFLPDGVDDSAETVVQPDILVVCDRDKINDDGIHGAPDFVAEVLSPATAYKDMHDKRMLYERSGVREYWIISPDSGSVFRYVLEGGRYGPTTEILRGEPVDSAALPGFSWKAPRFDYGSKKKA
jgi:Uma2 family endonuclease